jgi:folate-binding Fe-S cluster repair protein YgfZ
VSLAEDLTLLRGSVGGAVLPRSVVRVTGAEAVGYLQGQLSQDVAALPVGASSRSFVLQPQGKVDVWMRVTRTADAELLLDT